MTDSVLLWWLRSARAPVVTLLLVLVLASPLAVVAQESDEADKPAEEQATDEQGEKKEEEEKSIFYKVTVTATRTEEDAFEVPQPVLVVTDEEIKEQTPNTAADLLRNLPGVDVNGVGSNQPRPLIRGQRGQRILLLEDGLNLNNPRRESDFGEIPALVDVSDIERVEVVRGPGSVLYGSDAIGGVINMITRPPATGTDFGGSVGYRWSSHDSQSKWDANINGTAGRLNYLVSGSSRSTDPYDAPAGSYGDITLDQATTVNDTGIEDDSFTARLGYQVGRNQEVFFKYERYRADNAGFGWIDPAEYAPGDPTIQIVYPFQDFDAWNIGYRGENLDKSLADSVNATFYARNNERELSQDIFIPFFPGAGLELLGTTFTDDETLGLRAEATKLAARRHLITYGLDYNNDDSYNTRFSSEELIFPGPPSPPDISTTPNVPNADYTSWGVFAQDQMKWSDRFSAIVGARYQKVDAKTNDTPGLEDLSGYDNSFDSGVWAVNLTYSVNDNIKVVGSVGTAFRAPNIVESFFSGLSTEGSGYLRPNPDLEPETSLEYDLGMKYRRSNAYFEVMLFQNTIKDGIRLTDTGEMENGLPLYQYDNIDELEYEGIEVKFDWAFGAGISVGVNYSYLNVTDVKDPEDSVGDSYSEKLVGYLRWQHRNNRFWAEYRLRHNGDQTDIDLVDNPIGTYFPGFTVHSLRGGLTVWEHRSMTHRLLVGVENITDELYAEFTNASFFRPEPERYYVATYRIDF